MPNGAYNVKVGDLVYKRGAPSVIGQVTKILHPTKYRWNDELTVTWQSGKSSSNRAGMFQSISEKLEEDRAALERYTKAYEEAKVKFGV